MRQLVRFATEADLRFRIHVELPLGADAVEAGLPARDVETVVGARRARHRGRDGAEVELDHLGVHARLVAFAQPQALRLRVRLDERHLLVAAARHAQEVEGLPVDGEQRARAAVLGRHVGDAGALRGGKGRHARAEALDEAADDALRAQRLREMQRHVHGRHAAVQLARQLHADHARHERRDGLPERRGLGLDAADAPPQHADAVGGGRVRVGADHRVEVRERLPAFARHHDAREVLDVQLMADALPGRHDAHVLKRVLRPLQEAVALAVARELQLHVGLHGAGAAELVGDDGMIDDQIARYLRVDLGRVAPQRHARVAHDREVDEHRHAREVLEQHARGGELHFLARLAGQSRLQDALRVPIRLVVVPRVAQHVLQQHGQRVRKPFGPLETAHGVVFVTRTSHLDRRGAQVRQLVHVLSLRRPLLGRRHNVHHYKERVRCKRTLGNFRTKRISPYLRFSIICVARFLSVPFPFVESNAMRSASSAFTLSASLPFEKSTMAISMSLNSRSPW